MIQVGKRHAPRFFTGRSKLEDSCRAEFTSNQELGRRYRNETEATSVASEWGLTDYCLRVVVSEPE